MITEPKGGYIECTRYLCRILQCILSSVTLSKREIAGSIPLADDQRLFTPPASFRKQSFLATGINKKTFNRVKKFSFACACVYVFGLNLPVVPYVWLWQCLGKVGEVTNVDSDGDIRVKVSIFQKWTFNPACLQSLSEPRPFGNGTGEKIHNHHMSNHQFGIQTSLSIGGPLFEIS